MALYSHDAHGSGHVRRNLAIAHALAESPLSPDLLLLAGMPHPTPVDLPARADCLTLPSLSSPDGWGAGGLEPEVAIRVRAEVIAGALDAFDPDLLVVDELARGAFEELQPALNRRRHSGGRTVLGLRDVLDSPASLMSEWQHARATEAITEHYDAVWVYGDPRVFDPITVYDLPAVVAAKAHYTGYLAPPVRRPLRRGSPLVVCMVGGGQDGYVLGRTFLQMPLPAGVMALLVTGPHMPTAQRDHLERVAAQHGDRQVRQHVPSTLELLVQAHAVVSMGGYTAMCEILASGVPAFVVPRTTPRQDERLRAERLRSLGVVHTAALDSLRPDHLGRWVAHAIGSSRTSGAVIDTSGLSAIPRLAAQLCGGSVPASQGQVVPLRVAGATGTLADALSPVV